MGPGEVFVTGILRVKSLGSLERKSLVSRTRKTSETNRPVYPTDRPVYPPTQGRGVSVAGPWFRVDIPKGCPPGREGTLIHEEVRDSDLNTESRTPVCESLPGNVPTLSRTDGPPLDSSILYQMRSFDS